jgi:hypothetical protein
MVLLFAYAVETKSTHRTHGHSFGTIATHRLLEVMNIKEYKTHILIKEILPPAIAMQMMQSF